MLCESLVALCHHAEIWLGLTHSVQMQVVEGGGICTTRGNAPTEATARNQSGELEGVRS